MMHMTISLSENFFLLVAAGAAASMLTHSGWTCLQTHIALAWGNPMCWCQSMPKSSTTSFFWPRIPHKATWMGRRRVRASRHIPCCRGAATPHYTHLGDAAWIPYGRAPPGQLYIVPDLKMGAYRPARQSLMREIRLRFPRGREWRAPLRAGQAWHELRRSIAHIMHIDRI